MTPVRAHRYAAARSALDGRVWTGVGGDGDRGRVVTVAYPNGDTLAIFGCGVHIATFAPRGPVPTGGSGARVVVAAPGYAAVEVDCDIERQSAQHAGGGIARVVRRGNCTRSVTALPGGGGVIAIDYDTRVTVSVNGRLRLHRLDGFVITALDTGHVEVRPAASAAATEGTMGVGAVTAESDEEGDGAADDGRATPRSVRSEEDVCGGA